MIEFTNHAKRKIKERRLKKAWIVKTIKESDFTFASRSKRKIAYKKFTKLYLAVIYTKEKNNLIVITSHWDKDFKPKKL